MKTNNIVFRQTGTRHNWTCVRSSCRDLTFAKHTHEEISLSYAVRGGQKSYRRTGTVDLISDCASVMVVNHDEVHAGSQITDDGWQCEGLYIPIKCFIDHSYSTHDLERIPYFAPSIIKDPYLLNLIKYIVEKCFRDTSNTSLLELEVEESNLLDHLMGYYSCTSSKPGKMNKSKVHLAREAMYDNPLTDYNLEQLAAIANLNPSYFVRSFKAAYGISPYAYLIQLRIGIARKLLTDGMSISSTASICQFFDQSHFTKYFRKVFGITPGEYQKFITNKAR